MLKFELELRTVYTCVRVPCRMLRSCLFRTLRSTLRVLPSQGMKIIYIHVVPLLKFPFCVCYVYMYVGVVRWRLVSSGSGPAAEPVATQWNSPTVDDIHVAASRPVATGMNTG